MSDVTPKVKVVPGRSSGAVAILSAAIASVCCVLPPVLVVVGLGSLGAGALLGRFALPVLAAAVALLAVAWWGYLREARKLRAIAAPMRNEFRARASLVVATVVIGAMAGLQAYSRALAAWERAVLAEVERRGAVVAGPAAPPGLAVATLPVEGMECVTCEPVIERAVTDCAGVKEAEASYAKGSVTVTYDPAVCSIEAIVAAVNSTGYRARPPETAGAVPPSAAVAATQPADCCRQADPPGGDECCAKKEEPR